MPVGHVRNLAGFVLGRLVKIAHPLIADGPADHLYPTLIDLTLDVKVSSKAASEKVNRLVQEPSIAATAYLAVRKGRC